MKESIYRYRFSDAVEMLEITDTLLLAVTAAEALHGRAQVNLDSDFELNEEKRTCHIDASSDVGRDIARVFVEYLSHEIGEDKFTVEQSGKLLSHENERQDNEPQC